MTTPNALYGEVEPHLEDYGEPVSVGGASVRVIVERRSSLREDVPHRPRMTRSALLLVPTAEIARFSVRTEVTVRGERHRVETVGEDDEGLTPVMTQRWT